MKPIEEQILVVNPSLVAWPGDSLQWLLVGDHLRPATPFNLPASATAVLEAFLSPRSVGEVFREVPDETLKTAVSVCLQERLLLPASAICLQAADHSGRSPWSGFRFCDHSRGREEFDWRTRETRRHTLSGKLIQVLDGCIDDHWIFGAHRWLFQLSYRRLDSDTRHTKYSRHWVNTLLPAEDYVQAVPLFARIARLAMAASGNPHAVLKRIDAYSTSYGDLPLTHQDLEFGRGLTALLFGNAEWDSEWTGETVFCDDAGEATLLVPPRPGRLLVFDGALLHRAGAPARNCHEPRFALVFKFAT